MKPVFLLQTIARLIIATTIMVGSSVASASPASEHPEKPFLSSIPAIFLQPAKFEPKSVALTLYPERTKAIPFQNRNRLHYTYALQKNPEAPLVILIPGMGGIAFNGTTLYLAELAFNSGYSVITLPSSTHWSFALAASRSGRTGYLPEDGRDMYQLISVIRETLVRQHQITPNKFGLLGTSYGGLDGAFLLNEDHKYHLFNFDFLLMISPPLIRSAAISKVDQYYSAGDQWPEQHRQFLFSFAMGRSVEILRGQRKIDTYKHLQEAFPIDEPSLAWIMAQQFRNDILNSAYVGDLLEGKQTESAKDAFKGSISNYLQDTVYSRKAPSDERTAAEKGNESELIQVLSHNNNEIMAQKKIILFHSTNDFLSFPEGATLLGGLNLETHLYDFGGHLGLISDERIVKDLQERLLQLQNSQ